MSRIARVVIFAVAVLAGCSGSGAGSIDLARGFEVVNYQPAKRRPAPAVAGEGVTGAPIATSDYAGQVAVVNFWGSWCGPCRVEQPILERLSKEYAPRGVRFIGVDTRRDQRAAAQAHLREFNVTYPSVYDPSSRIAYAYRVRFMPATYVLDRSGKIAALLIGAIRNEVALRQILDREAKS